MGISIPKFNQPQVQVSSQPSVRVDPGATAGTFGSGGAFKEAQQESNALFDQTQKYYAAEKQKADEIKLTSFNSELTKLKNQLIYDPTDGLMNRKGQDAFGAPEEYVGRFNSQVEELKKGLSNSAQQAAGQRMVEGHLADLDGDIKRHVYAESKAYDEQTTTAALVTAHDDAVTNYQQPEKVRAALDAQAGTILRWASRQGYADSDPIVKQKLEEASSKTHMAVVERMLSNGQDLDAKAYFDQVKGTENQVTGEDASRIEKALEEGSIRGESQRLSLDITKRHGNLSQALAEADKIENSKVQDETRRRIKERFSEAEASRRDMNEKNHINALNVIDKSKNIDDVMKSPMWKNFSNSERNGLISYAKIKSEGLQPSTNWDDYYNLKTIAAEPTTREKFLKTNLMEYRPRMADSEFKQLVDLQTDLRNGGSKASSHLDGFLSDQEVVNGVLGDAGIDPKSDQGTSEGSRVNLFKAKVDREVLRVQEQTGKKVTNEELRAIADRLMIEGATDKGIFGSGFFVTKKRLFEIDPNEDKQFSINTDSIPRDERSKIEAALKKYNIPVSDNAVLQLYKKKIGGLVRDK
jgi:hypothetical protein